MSQEERKIRASRISKFDYGKMLTIQRESDASDRLNEAGILGTSSLVTTKRKCRFLLEIERTDSIGRERSSQAGFFYEFGSKQKERFPVYFPDRL